ncbi:unnamed protein product [Rhizophagus irregularis]|nr:unnamed protein product [Rhizophagus irregularis]
MIRFGFRVGFRSTEPQRFLQVGFQVPKNGKPRFVSGGLPGSKEWKRTKIRSGGLPNSEERKIKIRSGGLPGSEERKRTKIRSDGLRTNRGTKIRSGGLQTNEGIKIRSGRFRTNGRTKIRSGGLPKNENPKIKIRKIGRLPKNENPKIKIRSGLSEERKKTKDSVSVFRRTEKTKIRLVGFRVLKNNGKPRFVWCLGWVPMNRKKPKIYQDS